MSIIIKSKSGTNYTFEGPYTSTNYLADKSGVYAIIDKKASSSRLLDVGESSEVKTRIERHDRQREWERKRQGTLTVAVCYTPNKKQEGRKEIEQDIRQLYGNEYLCGTR